MLIQGGNGDTGNDNGGEVAVIAGAPQGDGDAGPIYLMAGDAGGNGNGGNIEIMPGDSVGGAPGFVNVAGDIVPATDNAHVIGGANRWAAADINEVRSAFFSLRDFATYFRSVDITEYTLPSGNLAQGLLHTNDVTGALGLASLNSAAADSAPTFDVRIETGNKTAGTGDSGSIVMRTGSSAGGETGNIDFEVAGAPIARINDDGLNVEGSIAVNNTDYLVRSANTTTTDATVTTLQTIAIPTDTTVLIEARVTARRTGGSAGTNGDSAYYIVRGRAKNIAGTVTLHDVISEESEDQAGWDADLDVDSTDVRVRVTGAVDNNITWIVAAITQQV